MTNETPAQPEGLRVRKKRATENAIETSAVDLALELGIENVTVEMICERADISRSTFFNYFAGRDYAIVGRAIQALQGDEAFAVLSSSPDNVPLGVVRLIFASIGHQHINTEVARKRARLTEEQSEAQRLSSVSLLESSLNLTTPVFEWLLANPGSQKMQNPEQETTMVIAIAHAMFASLLIEMHNAEGDILPSQAAIDRSLDNIRLLVN